MFELIWFCGGILLIVLIDIFEIIVSEDNCDDDEMREEDDDYVFDSEQIIVIINCDVFLVIYVFSMLGLYEYIKIQLVLYFLVFVQGRKI